MCWEPPGSSQSPRPTGHFVISQSHLPPKWNFHGISETQFEHNCFSAALVVGREAWFEVTPQPVLCCLFHSWALLHITVGWEHPKHPAGVKLSWIIRLGNGFEAKGYLQQEVICCGCHHLGKGLFRGAGEVGGCAVDFPVADCLLLNSTVQTPRTHCFLLWEGIGAWVGGTQEFSAHCGAGGRQAPSWSAG